MKLSIIIPVFNIARYLDRCLESIIFQSFQDLEILLIDDGSNDASASLCDAWQLRDSRIRVFHNSNGGVSSARNIGLENARGEFITFVDGDDYILQGMYARLMALQQKEDADIAICGFANEKADGTAVPYFSCDEVKTLSQQEQVKCVLTNTYFTCSCWDKVFRRTLLQDIRYNPNISHLEDLLFLYQAMKRSHKAVFTSEPFYRYCENDRSSAARQPFGDKQMTMLDVWDYIYKDSITIFPQLKQIIDAQYYRNYIMCAMMAHRSGYVSSRILHFLRRNILHILSSSLSLGYKHQALRNCLNL